MSAPLFDCGDVPPNRVFTWSGVFDPNLTYLRTKYSEIAARNNMPLPSSPHPNMVTQPLIFFVALTCAKMLHITPMSATKRVDVLLFIIFILSLAHVA